MAAVWKYPLNITDTQEVWMPPGAKALTVQVQQGVPCLWALVDDVARHEDFVPRRVHVHGTGHLVEDGFGLDYISSFQTQILGAGVLVFHVFIAPEA